MNKKIKIIDLMQKCANKENIPERILYKNTVFVLNDCKCYYNEEKDERLLDYIIPTFSNLNEEVEILEDNTEEIEELDKFDIQGLEVSGYLMTQAEYLLEDGIEENRQKINELVRKINCIERKMNENWNMERYRTDMKANTKLAI